MEGEAWEILSRVGTSGRQRVDSQETVPDHNNTCFVTNHTWIYEWRTVLMLMLWPPALILLVQQRALRFFIRHCQVYPLSTWHQHMIKFPRPSPSVFAYCKQEVGTAWERGYT